MRNKTLLLLTALTLAACSGNDKGAERVVETPPLEARSYDVHIFYYTWYGTPEVDGEYHAWTGDIPGRETGPLFFGGGNDIASSFFPAYGPYSSMDPDIIKSHVDQIAVARIGVICIDWKDADSRQAAPVKAIMDAAASSNLKVCFRLQYSDGRTPADAVEQVGAILDIYGDHRAFYHADRFGGRPVFYIDPSWPDGPEPWASFLSPSGDSTIRGTDHDAIFLAVWEDRGDGDKILRSGFDGFYTWFAAKGASWGSDPYNFQEMNIFALENRLLFVPTVSPGFDDTRIDPSNDGAVRIRGGGSRYMESAQAALKVSPVFISVNSFNCWPDGTQIEPARPMVARSFQYRDYGAGDTFLYLKLSAQWIGGFSR